MFSRFLHKHPATSSETQETCAQVDPFGLLCITMGSCDVKVAKYEITHLAGANLNVSDGTLTVLSETIQFQTAGVT